MSKKSKQYGFAYSPPQAPCHEGNVFVGASGNVSIYGGGHSRDCDISAVDLAFDLAHSPSSTPLFQMNSVALNHPAFERLRRVTPVISITWPDYSVPAISRSRWNEIVLSIRAFAVEPINVLFCCQGGHGRTGTAIAIISSLLNIIPENEDPVKWVRAKYCKKAIESNEQLDYLEFITGRRTTEPAYKESFAPLPVPRGGDIPPQSIIESAKREIYEVHPDLAAYFTDD